MNNENFYYKIHRARGETILAVCDADIAGKHFVEKVLRLEVKKDFYCGEKINESVTELFDEATIINLIGRKIVSLAMKKGWVDKKSIIKIKGVPHAQIVKI